MTGSLRTLVGAAALALVACGGAQRQTQSLDEAIRAYNEGVRWERFAVAAVHVPPAERGDFVEDMDERAEDLKVTEYDLVKVEPRGGKEARVQVKVKWYRTSEGTLRETHAVQTWERHGKAWWMVGEARLRGAEMPGLTEQGDAPAGGAPAEAPPAAEPAPPAVSATR